MADEWIGVVKQAGPRYLKGAIDLTIRKRLILAMLEARGQIITNFLGSHETVQDLDYTEAPVEDFADGAQVTYARRDYLKQMAQDWRGYKATDLITLKEQEMIKGGGPNVMVNRYKRIFPKLVKSLRNQIGLEFYIDGYAAGNENRFCGTKSFTTKGACAATDIIAQPNDTYLGVATNVNQSGTWSADLSTKPNATIATDWPEGQGSTDYDFNAPKLANWSSSNWGTSKQTWVDNCIVVMRRMIQWLSLTAGVDGISLMTMLAGHMMTDFKTALDAKTRILLPHKEAEDLGFPDTLNFEGMGVKSEFGIATNTGYALNVDEVELQILCNKLINQKGPDYDPKSAGYTFLVYTFGNFKFLPKHCGEYYNYAA